MRVNNSVFLSILVSMVLIGCSQGSDVQVEKPELHNKAMPSTLEKDQDREQDSDEEKIAETTYTYVENPAADLLKENTDYAGWIRVNNTIIDEPVVKGRDNEFYLDHDFYKEKNKYGAVFMDYRNIGFEYSKNTILYGHNAKNSLRFGPLEEFLEETKAREATTITIQTLFDEVTYEVFAFYFDAAEPQNIQVKYTENEPFEKYIEKALSKSIYDYDVSLTPEDQILTLVTCSYDIDDGRYFIHAKRQ